MESEVNIDEPTGAQGPCPDRDKISECLPSMPPDRHDVDYCFRELDKQIYNFRENISNSVYDTKSKVGREIIRQKYSEWLLLYERYFDLNDKYIRTLSVELYDEYTSTENQSRLSLLTQFKSEMEAILTKEETASRKPSCHSTSVKSSASSLMARRAEEEQKRAELEVKLLAFQEEQKLREQEFQLNAKKQELELRTQLDVAKARSRVLESPMFNPTTQSTVQFKTNDELDTIEYGHTAQRNPPPSNTEVKHTFFVRDDQPRFAHSTPDVRRRDGFRTQENREVVDPNASAMSESVVSMAKLLKRPTFEIPKFSGDPIQFRRFMRQFHTKVTTVCDDDYEKMTYLEQLTSGEAHRVVCGYSHLSPSIGYNAAVKELTERYGDEQDIANAYIQKALNWQSIKIDDVKSLDEYAMFLKECLHAIGDVNALGVLEYHENMKAIVKKIPYQLHDKWRSVVQHKRELGFMVRFQDLVEFVAGEARKARDSVFGRDALKAQFADTAKGKTKQVKKASFAVNASNQGDKVSKAEQSTGIKCNFCKENYHPLATCKKFGQLRYDDKVKHIKENALCFGCLKRNHVKKDCRRKLQCAKCGEVHPTCLHVEKLLNKSNNGQSEVSNTNVSVSQSVSLMGAGSNKMCTMAIVPVNVSLSGKAKVVQTYAFLDPGSSVCFCTESLYNQLGGSGKDLKLKIRTMGNTCVFKTKEIKGLQLSSIDGNDEITLPEVYTKKNMPVQREHIPTNSDIQQWPHLEDVRLPCIEGEIGLLIGNNAVDVYSPLEVRTGPRGSPHATKSPIGWIPWNVVRESGTCTDVPTVNRVEVLAIEEMQELKQLDRLVRNSIDAEFPERCIDEKKEQSVEDKLFLTKVSNTIQHKDGHFYINLPFRKDNVVMPNNIEQAQSRLDSLKKKMSRDPDYKSEYTTFMNTLFNKGYAENVPVEDLQKADGKVWYLPHHGVLHPTKKKLRVVFDCSATYNGVSLNQQLLPSPNLTNSLLGVLLRFREDPIAIMGDIEAMYYQVRVPSSDRDFLRFLWFPNGDVSRKPQVYRMCVHIFGATSSPACATAALQETAKLGSEEFKPEVIDTVFNHFYVDDYLRSLPSDEQAINMIANLKELCQKGGFNVAKWISNSRRVNESIPEDSKAKTIQKLDMKTDGLPVERALGVVWDTNSDTFCFKVITKIKPPTRRNVLSITSSVYDPLGFAAPCTLYPKTILRELCGHDWDEPLSEELAKKWNKWQDELPTLEEMKIPRCVKSSDSHTIIERQVHHFSDASNNGYGTVSYLRTVDNNGKIHCSLVMSKSRVAPLKRVTIPRLELTAAKLAVQMNRIILNEMQCPVTKVYFWVDSTSVLKYIHNSKARYHTFVANRVSYIREATATNQWNFVPGNCNPADLASRGTTPTELMNSRWFAGPEFLWLPEDQWSFPHGDLQLLVDDPEVKVNAAAVPVSSSFVDQLLNKYSNYSKLKAVVGRILMYQRNLKRWVARRDVLMQTLASKFQDKIALKLEVDRRIKREKLAHKIDIVPNLSVDDLEEAEEVLIMLEQRQVLHEEIQQLSEDKSVKRSSPLRRLDPILVDDVVRVGGRISRAKLPAATKHPAIIPKNSRLAWLIVMDTHRKLGHSGRNAILAEINQRVWIIGANPLIKRLVSKCAICRKYSAAQMKQKMANLPASRLQFDQPPFTNTGCDFFGPFEIKRGRSIVKRYGVIFTCLTTRAVHIEMADSLDTDSCINSIRRFLARRGHVRVIVSDQGSNFVSANRELETELQRLNNAKIQHLCAQKGIEWTFNPPAASHFGGVWERLIRSIRRILFGLLKEQTIRLNDDGLCTLFCEVEYILNSRPITKVPNSPNDIEALTPNDLLLFRNVSTGPPGLFSRTDSYVKRRWRQIQYLADVFWHRWIKEYVPLLQERQKWFKPERNVKVGDIVLVVDNTPRNTWVLGKVLNVLADKNNLVRVVTVKTKSAVLDRPVSKLCLVLEAD